MTFGDDEMHAALAEARPYSLMILRDGPNADADDAPQQVWEHGRRNFALRADGELVIVLPVTDDSDVCGVGVFAATVERTVAIMEDDPGVRAGVFTFEVHPCLGFPGDALP